MKNNGYIIVLGIVGLFSILSTRENYKNNSSVPEFKSLAPYTEEGLEVSYKTLSSEESTEYLSRDLTSYGYQPIHVTIQNNTPNQYEISPTDVSLPLDSGKDVAGKITKASLPRAIAFKVASFFFWPLMIPSTVDSIKTYATHRSLKKNFAAKALKVETLLPFSTTHRILFVQKEKFQEYFTMTFVNKDSEEKATFEST